jgi:hypothetical protein
MSRPPLPGFDYIGPRAYFLTISTFDRFPWFMGEDCANLAISQLLRTATDYGQSSRTASADHAHARQAIRTSADL